MALCSECGADFEDPFGFSAKCSGCRASQSSDPFGLTRERSVSVLGAPSPAPVVEEDRPPVEFARQSPAQQAATLVARARAPSPDWNAIATDAMAAVKQGSAVINDLYETREGRRILDGLVIYDSGKFMLAQSIFKMLPTLGLGGLALEIPRLVATGRWNPNWFTAMAIGILFNVNLEPKKFSYKALLLMWTAFRMVPRSHVRGAALSVVRGWSPESSYSSAGKVIKMARLPTSMDMGMAEFALRGIVPALAGVLGLVIGGVFAHSKFLMRRSIYSQRMRSKNAFLMTALHEIGHAVDDKFRIMSQYGERWECGGWIDYQDGASSKKYSYSMLADLSGKLTDEPGTEIRKRSFIDVIERTTKLNYNKLSRAVAANFSHMSGEQKARALRLFKAHPGLAMFNANCIDGHSFGKNCAYSKTRATLKPLSVAYAQDEGVYTFHRVFHRSYEWKWASYLIEMKDMGVSHYQWRAQGEWFAELYAHYWLGTLQEQPAHPLVGWLDAIKALTDTDDAPDPRDHWDDSHWRTRVVDGFLCWEPLTGPIDPVDVEERD